MSDRPWILSTALLIWLGGVVSESLLDTFFLCAVGALVFWVVIFETFPNIKR